jgi:LacI family transcriptional regulator
VVTLDLSSQYALEIVRGIADELAANELEVLISATYQDSQRERDRIQFLAQGLVDGIVMIAPVLDDVTIAVLRERRCPFVIVDPRRLDIDVPRVSVDNYRGMREGTQHLIDLGHRRIAYIGGDSDFDSSTARFHGFQEAMRLAGLEVDPNLVAECDFTYACGRRIASQMIETAHPTAIIAGADLIALGAIDAGRLHGLAVPGQLSVVGFDDLPQASQSLPGLTTVRQPLHEMGMTAVRALLAQIAASPPLIQHLQLPTSLVIRGTAGPPMSMSDATPVQMSPPSTKKR